MFEFLTKRFVEKKTDVCIFCKQPTRISNFCLKCQEALGRLILRERRKIVLDKLKKYYENE